MVGICFHFPRGSKLMHSQLDRVLRQIRLKLHGAVVVVVNMVVDEVAMCYCRCWALMVDMD
jgi:hypothetical protein